MKKMISLVAAVSILATAAGCGSSGSGTGSSSASPSGSQASAAPKEVKLRMAWWGAQPRHDYTIKVIEMYEKLHPNVKIDYEYAAFDEYWKKLAPQAAASDLPDIMQMDFSYLSQYAGKDQLEDLTPFTKTGTLDVKDVSESALSGGKMNNKLYGMNLGVNAMAMWMDPEVLKKANITKPTDTWTWSDMEQLGMKLKDQNLYLTGQFVPEQFFAYYLRQNGQHLYSADGTGLGYTDDKMFVDYFSRTQRLALGKAIYSPDQVAQVKAPEDGDLIKGKMAFGIGYSNQFIADATLAKRNLEFIPVPGPNIDKGLFLKPSMYFSVAKNSKQKEEAAKFISFFINDIEANKLINGDRGVPVSSKVKESLKATNSPDQQKVFDYIAWAEKHSSTIDPPDPIGSAEVTKALRDLQDQMYYDKIKPEEAATKFRKQATEILAKNKK